MRPLSLLFILSFAPAWAFAQGVSLLQETQDIECTVGDGADALASLWIDKKDYELKLTHTDGTEEEFHQVKFLDRAILAKSKKDPAKHLFFQIQTNGETSLQVGELISFKEADCEDTGASKKCKNAGFKNLLWTPETLKLKGHKENRSVEISRYGFFPNKATFAFGQEKKKASLGYPSLLLIDYGAPLEMLVGSASTMKCGYKK